MKNTLHTPGPWVIHTCNKNGPSLDSFYLSTTAQTGDGNEEERIICRFPTGTGQFSEMGRENLANAHLISAAPDLLSICEEIANDLKCDLVNSERRIRLYSAIRKANGEAIAKN